MRIIEVITDQGHVDTLRGIAAQQEIVDICSFLVCCSCSISENSQSSA